MNNILVLLFTNFLKMVWYVGWRLAVLYAIYIMIQPKTWLLIYYTWKDFKKYIKEGRKFDLFGITMFCGWQGEGKTISMVEYLEWVRVRYPKCKIYTNFDYKYQTAPFDDWNMFLEVKPGGKLCNGEDGVIFAVDELHSEFEANEWRNFPHDLLRQICMQRKQKVHIIGSAQFFRDVVVKLRRQTFYVVDCSALKLKFIQSVRLISQKWYMADVYNLLLDSNNLPSSFIDKLKFKPVKKYSFVQSEELRSLFDTDKVIEKMIDLIPQKVIR